MAAPVFDVSKPAVADGWGVSLTYIRENIVSLAMYAAANGGRVPNWDTAFTYASGKLSEMVLTYKPTPTVKIRVTYSYIGDSLDKESLYFDKGLGAGYELLSNGVLTYGYSGGNVSTVTAANS